MFNVFVAIFYQPVYAFKIELLSLCSSSQASSVAHLRDSCPGCRWLRRWNFCRLRDYGFVNLDHLIIRSVSLSRVSMWFSVFSINENENFR